MLDIHQKLLPGRLALRAFRLLHQQLVLRHLEQQSLGLGLGDAFRSDPDRLRKVRVGLAEFCGVFRIDLQHRVAAADDLKKLPCLPRRAPDQLRGGDGVHHAAVRVHESGETAVMLDRPRQPQHFSAGGSDQARHGDHDVLFLIPEDAFPAHVKGFPTGDPGCDGGAPFHGVVDPLFGHFRGPPLQGQIARDRLAEDRPLGVVLGYVVHELLDDPVPPLLRDELRQIDAGEELPAPFGNVPHIRLERVPQDQRRQLVGGPFRQSDLHAVAQIVDRAAPPLVQGLKRNLRRVGGQPPRFAFQDHPARLAEGLPALSCRQRFRPRHKALEAARGQLFPDRKPQRDPARPLGDSGRSAGRGKLDHVRDHVHDDSSDLARRRAAAQIEGLPRQIVDFFQLVPDGGVLADGRQLLGRKSGRVPVDVPDPQDVEHLKKIRLVHVALPEPCETDVRNVDPSPLSDGVFKAFSERSVRKMIPTFRIGVVHLAQDRVFFFHQRRDPAQQDLFALFRKPVELKDLRSLESGSLLQAVHGAGDQFAFFLAEGVRQRDRIPDDFAVLQIDTRRKLLIAAPGEAEPRRIGYALFFVEFLEFPRPCFRRQVRFGDPPDQTVHFRQLVPEHRDLMKVTGEIPLKERMQRRRVKRLPELGVVHRLRPLEGDPQLLRLVVQDRDVFRIFPGGQVQIHGRRPHNQIPVTDHAFEIVVHRCLSYLIDE